MVNVDIVSHQMLLTWLLLFVEINISILIATSFILMKKFRNLEVRLAFLEKLHEEKLRSQGNGNMKQKQPRQIGDKVFSFCNNINESLSMDAEQDSDSSSIRQEQIEDESGDEPVPRSNNSDEHLSGDRYMEKDHGNCNNRQEQSGDKSDVELAVDHLSVDRVGRKENMERDHDNSSFKQNQLEVDSDVESVPIIKNSDDHHSEDTDMKRDYDSNHIRQEQSRDESDVKRMSSLYNSGYHHSSGDKEMERDHDSSDNQQQSGEVHDDVSSLHSANDHRSGKTAIERGCDIPSEPHRRDMKRDCAQREI